MQGMSASGNPGWIPRVRTPLKTVEPQVHVFRGSLKKETWPLDEQAKKPPRVDHSKAHHVFRMIDDFSTDCLLSVSTTPHKTPSEITGEMVRERVATSAPRNRQRRKRRGAL